jgi:TrmH family RNA methyltransferase
MPVRIVQSKQNARLKELRRALTKPPRAAGELPPHRAENAQWEPRFAGIEGPNLIREAVRANVRIPSVFVAQGSERLLDELFLLPETEVLVLPPALLSASLATETPQPIAALVEPRTWEWEHLLSGRRNAAPLIVVLAGLQDPGNVGTILRSAEAFGATGVVSLTGTVSAWNPKAVRASAGSIFRMPMIAATAEECFLRLHEQDVTLWTTAMHHAKEVHRADLTRGVALIIGNEGNGVPQEVATHADGALTIPYPGPVESLNAAIATSVLLYEAARQRATAPASVQRQRSAR